MLYAYGLYSPLGLYVDHNEVDQRPVARVYYNLGTEHFNLGDYEKAQHYMMVTANYNEIHDADIKPGSKMGEIIKKAEHKHKIVNQRIKILKFQGELNDLR